MSLFGKLFGNKDDITDYPSFTTDNGKFHFIIDDVFTVTGRGTVVTGKVVSGEVHVGDIVNLSDRVNTEVIGIEMFRKTLDVAQNGDVCGIFLKDIPRDEVHKGDYLTK